MAMEVDALNKGGKKGGSKNDAGKKGGGKNKDGGKSKDKGKSGKFGKTSEKKGSTGKGSASTSDKFAGYCGKWGHKGSECWWAMAGKPKDPKTVSGVEDKTEAALLAEWPEQEDQEESWMMGLSKGLPVCALHSEPEEVWALIDSGSAITAASWELGCQFDTRYVPPEKRPKLTSVSGSPIEYHGK